MVTISGRAIFGFALMCLSSSLLCWGDEPNSSPQLPPDVFVLVPDANATTTKPKATNESESASESEAAKPPKEPASDYRVRLESGEVIDIGAIFRPEIEEFQASLRKRVRQSKPPMIRIYDNDSAKPILLAERRGAVLNGLFAAFTEDGAPVAHTSYDRGKRSSTLFTWDDAKRPLVFEQYSDGKVDGIRCLFRGCCESCTGGHPWLIQQWEKGELRSAHLVRDNGNVQTFKYLGDSDGIPYGGSTPELDAAMLALGKFQKRLTQDEKQMKLVASSLYEQDKQLKQIASRRRSSQVASLFRSGAYAPVGGRSGGFGGG